jgi:hypothetical protein
MIIMIIMIERGGIIGGLGIVKGKGGTRGDALRATAMPKCKPSQPMTELGVLIVEVRLDPRRGRKRLIGYFWTQGEAF